MNWWYRAEKKEKTAVVLLLGIALFFFVLPELITLNLFIPSFSKRFLEATGRTLSVEEARLSFLRGPTLTLSGVEVGGKGEEKPFSTIRTVRIGFQLLPLLWKTFVVRDIEMTEPSVALSRDRKGEWNFEDLTRGEKGGGWTVTTRLSDLRFEKGKISLTDRSVEGGPVHWNADGIRAEVKNLWVKNRLEIRLDSPAVRQAERGGETTAILVRGVVDGKKKEPGSNDTRLSIVLTDFHSGLIEPYLELGDAPPIRAERSAFTLEGNSRNFTQIRKLVGSPHFRLDGESKGVDLLISKTLPPITIEEAKWHYSQRQITFDLSRLRFIKSDFQKFSGAYHLNQNRDLDLETAGRFDLVDLGKLLASERINNDQLKMWQAEGLLDVAVAARLPLNHPKQLDLKGRMMLREAEFSPWTTTARVRKAAGEARFEGNALEVETFTGEWGGAPFRMTGRVPDVLKNGLEFTFEAPFMDVGAVVVGPGSSSQAGSSPSAGEPSPEERQKSGAPPEAHPEKKGYAVGLIKIGHLHYDGYDFREARSALIYKERALEFKETKATLNDGLFEVDFAQVYFREDGSISLAATPHLSDVNFESTLKDYNKNDERPIMSGRLLLMGGLNTEGRNWEEFKKNLRGDLVVYLENGMIYRFKALARIFSLMNLRRLPNLNLKGLPYRVIYSKLSIEEGMTTLHDAVIFGKDIRMMAKGKVNLANRELDIETGVQVFKVVDEIIQSIPVGGYILQGKDKMFIAAYFDINGTIEDPKVRFRPLKTVQEALLNVLKRILTFPLKPKIFQKEAQ